MKLEVLETNWNGKMCYLGFIKYEDLSKVINVKEDLSMNRKVNPDRVKKISEYIKDNKEKVFFPPVILNCSDNLSIINDEEKLKKIDIKQASLTIIDGQHRISSIIKVLKDCNKENRIGIEEKKIAFLLIEAVEDSEHRDLFNLINESSANVEATVSARFKISYENLYGLRYVKNNIKVKDLIEWELKQSSDKICYLFITDMNKELLKFIDKKINNPNQKKSYETLAVFWNKYFEFIVNLNNDMKSFYVKKVVLRTLVKTIIDDLVNDEYKKEEAISDYESLIKKIENVLGDLLINEFRNKYEGYYKQSRDTYEVLLDYLIEEREELLKVEVKEIIQEDKIEEKEIIQEDKIE